MSSHSQDPVRSLVLSIISSFFLIHSQAIDPVPSSAKPGCQEKCENLTIPYPFGIGEGCYLDKPFQVVCNKSLNFSPLHFVNGPPIREISLLLHSVSIYQEATAGCYNHPTPRLGNYTFNLIDRQPYFSWSNVSNQFMVLGCNFFAYVVDGETGQYTSWCGSGCEENNRIRLQQPAGDCAGIGCCQTNISKDMTKFEVGMDTINTLNDSLARNPRRRCGVAFIVDKNFSGYGEILDNISRVVEMGPSYAVPVILNWVVGQVTCREARETQTSACGNNTSCTDLLTSPDYHCGCSKGYQGNPYLPNGCQDFNECEYQYFIDYCPREARCVNTPGSFKCICPRGYHLDDSEPTFRCKRNKYSLAEYVTIGANLFC